MQLEYEILVPTLTTYQPYKLISIMNNLIEINEEFSPKQLGILSYDSYFFLCEVAVLWKKHNEKRLYVYSKVTYLFKSERIAG